MWKDHLLLGMLWIVYGVLHSVLASIWFKVWAKKRLGTLFRYYRLLYTLFALITLFLLLLFLFQMPSYRLYNHNYFTYFLGGCLLFTGLAIMLVCIKKYFLSLSGIRTLAAEKPASELIITGIHKYIRHPLYLGTFIFIWGLFVMIPTVSLLITNIIITVYTLIGTGYEEKKLEMEFGNSYRQYKKSVPKIIPRFRF
jgi:methanethiol S-methyltransferase